MKHSRLLSGFVALSLLTPVLARAEAAAAPTAQQQQTDGKDFIDEAKRLYRVVSCAGDDAVPADLDKPTVDAHCKQMKARMAAYDKKYIQEAKPFLAKIVPPGLPTTVVYPFGGGDLLSVLTTYPDATDITTMSLEHAGDPRRIVKLPKAKLATSLNQLRGAIWGLLTADNSTTENMQNMQHSDVPGQIAFFLTALALYDYEPVSMKFFKLNPDGTVHYLSEAEIAALEKEKAKTLRGGWDPPDNSVAFSNVEIRYKSRKDPNGPVRVHRHMAANLGDDGLQKDPSVIKYLEAKGRVSAITKAASYLLWRDDFGTIRKYLIDHMEWMISDSTGIPPKYLEGTKWEQVTYGRFVGSLLPANEDINKSFRALWKAQPARKLPFRYGYVDSSGNSHMLVTQQKK